MGSTPIPITSECFCFSPSCSQLIDSSRNLSGACCRAEQLGAACPMVRRLFCMQVIGVRFPGGPLAGSILDTCNPMECNGRIPCFRKVAGYGLPGRSAKSFVARVTWRFKSLAFRYKLLVDRYSIGECANHEPLLFGIVVGVTHSAFFHDDRDWRGS